MTDMNLDDLLREIAERQKQLIAASGKCDVLGSGRNETLRDLIARINRRP